jgi:transglutaminase-like putative cysteine protease
MFIKKIYCIALTGFAISIACSKLYAQPKDINKDLYKASTIPDSLKENANDVIRYQSDDITVKSPGHAIYKHYRLATILNEKGDHEAEIGIGYEKKYNTVNAVSIKVYNADGMLIKKYGKSDMYDRSAIDNETIVTDDRYLYLRHTIASYPVTIEISYEYDYNSFFNLPSWYIQSPEVAVQTSICKVTFNPTTALRFQGKNISPALTKGKENDLETYTWVVKNLKAEKAEEDVPDWRTDKLVNFTTNQFSFFGKPGTFDSWANYGKWVNDLNSDVCTLPEPRAEEIIKMTADLKTDKEKAKFLYNYLQQNMRYVSIQLGVGGFKPFPAAFVDQKKYGDCKALSNYMYALLKAVNIPSYYALINAGTNEEPADANFPYDPFNHAILCVPFKGDTTWLECTSTTQPFGKLGSFTENRKALLITEEGGKLVNTPRSIMADNTFNSDVHITLQADGGAKAKIKILTTGEYRDSYISMSSQKMDYQKELLIRRLHMKQPSVLECKFVDNKEDIKEIDLDLEYDKFCDVAAGDKQFYRPSVIDLWYATVPVMDKRNADYYFDYPMQKTSTTTIELPPGFEIESLPTNVSLKFTYGSYNVSYQYLADKNEVVSTTNLNLSNQVIPAAKYNEMQHYMDNITKAQNKKLVIRHKAS